MLIGMAFAIVWLGYVTWSTQSFQACRRVEYKEESWQPTEKNQSEVTSLIVLGKVWTKCFGRFLYETRDALTAIATVFIALFTYTLYRATTQQARITTDALELARNEFVSSWRPKLRVSNIVVSKHHGDNIFEELPIFTAGKPLKGELYIVNVGGTPAKLLRGKTIVFWSEAGLPMELPYARMTADVYVGGESLAPENPFKLFSRAMKPCQKMQALLVPP